MSISPVDDTCKSERPEENQEPRGTKRIRKSVFNRSIFEESTKERRFNPLPPSQKHLHSRSSASSSDPFSGRLKRFKDDTLIGLKTFQDFAASFTKVYQAPNNKIYHLVRQPQTTTSSCGAGAAMMFYLSAVRHKDPNKFAAHALQTLSMSNDPLWEWAAGCRLADGEEVANALNAHFYLKDLGLSAELQYYKECEAESPDPWDSEEEEALLNQELKEQAAFLLGPSIGSLPNEKAAFTEVEIQKNKQDNQQLFKDIESILQDTGCSIILAITNKVFAGHWIVVDYLSVADNRATISDPNTAEAYSISLQELGENLPPDDGRVSLISIQSI